MAQIETSAATGRITLHFDVYQQGERPWVVFAHGAGGNAASWWQQVPVFYQYYNVLTFDHRAFGRSRCPVEHFDPAVFADDLEAILGAAGVERAALVCQSMGGRTGLEFARRNPERVAALVMSHTVGALSNDQIKAARDSVADRGPGSPLKPSEPFGSWAVALDFPQKNLALSHLYNCIGAANTDFAAVGIGGLRNRGASLSPAELDRFDVPTLFITSDDDVVIPAGAVAEGHRAIAGSQLVNLGAVGHSSYFESAAAFNEVTLTFLAKHVR